MYSVELETPSQQNISDEFLNIIDQIRETQKPGRMFDLTKEPTKDELKFLTDNYGREIGLVYLIQLRSWVMIEGTKNEVNMPREIDELVAVNAHYHPSEKLPSIIDVFNINPRGKNFMFTPSDLTYFSGFKIHPITGLPWKQQDREEITLEDVAYIDIIISRRYESKEKFMHEMGVTIVRKPWQELPNNPFSGFKLAV